MTTSSSIPNITIPTGAEIVSRALQRHGIRTVFALAGAAHYLVLDALNRDGVRIVGSRHESATVLQADGYSRVTGRPGIALIIANQGLANAIGGITSAYEACAPVVVLVARPPLSQDEPGQLTDVDELALARPVTKWARTVHDVDRLEEYVDLACRRALAGRPGPVVLAIPMDVLAARPDAATPLDEPLTDLARREAAPELIERAATLLWSAERPLIVAGSGAGRSGAAAAHGLRRLAQEQRIPVLGSGLGRGLVPEDLVVGFPWPLAQVAAKEADIVLVAGSRLNHTLGYGRAPRFSPAARFIQINVDDDELGRNRPVDVPIVADAGRALLRIADAVARRGYRPRGNPTWVNDAIRARLDRIEEIGHDDAGPIHPYRIARELTAVLPEDAIVVGDGADVLNWFHAILRIRQAPGYLDHQPLGSMGVGTPLAIGAAAAARELAEASGGQPRPVVLVTGDGSFGFYATELNSAVQAGLPIAVLISNDGGWGTERHAQAKAIGRTVNVDLGTPRYDLVAAGYGACGELVEAPAEVGPAIRRALAAGQPTVLNIVTDPAAGRLRKEDPRLQMVPHDDIMASRRSHYTPPIA